MPDIWITINPDQVGTVSAADPTPADEAVTRTLANKDAGVTARPGPQRMQMRDLTNATKRHAPGSTGFYPNLFRGNK